MQHLAAALHPGHGALVMNMHGGGPPAPSLARLLSGAFRSARAASPGYDPESGAGAAVERTAQAFRCFSTLWQY